MKKKKFLGVIMALLFVAAMSMLAVYLKDQVTQQESSSQQHLRSSHRLTKKRMPRNRIDNERKRKWFKSSQPISFPILMYHSLSSGNSLRVPPSEFKAEMQWLKKAGYYTLTPEEAYRVLTTNEKPAEKIVWITLDDGYLDNYQSGLPIFKATGVKATVNMITGFMHLQHEMNLDMLKEMKENGISIQSHTVHHLELNKLPYNQQLFELTTSKQTLDEDLKQRTISIAYPVGRSNQETVRAAQVAGYKMGMTTQPGLANRTQGLFQLKRVRINPGINQQTFLTLLQRG